MATHSFGLLPNCFALLARFFHVFVKNMTSRCMEALTIALITFS
jgi:hypothetical protein